MIRKIDHVGIAVGDDAAGRDVFERLLGLTRESETEVASQRVRVAFYPCDNVQFELLRATSADGPVARFLATRGEGLHHVAFEVDDVRRELERARSQGLELVDAAPRPGAHGTLVGFLHPKSTHGILVEFVERPRTPKRHA